LKDILPQSYVIYGHLHDAGDVGYFRFIMSPDRPGPYGNRFFCWYFSDLFFALVSIMLVIWALRVARSTTLFSIKDRLSPGIIGLLGLLFWAGIITGPGIAFFAAMAPEPLQINAPVQ
jgi:hypothetical protein